MENLDPIVRKRLAVIGFMVIIAISIVLISFSIGGDETTFPDETEVHSGGELAVLVTDLEGPYTITYLATVDREIYQMSISNSSPAGRQKALQWLTDQGYELSKLDIQFIDFQNPLGEGQAID